MSMLSFPENHFRGIIPIYCGTCTRRIATVYDHKRRVRTCKFKHLGCGARWAYEAGNPVEQL